MSPGFVSDILRGNKRPGCEFLFNLRQSMGVSIDWLLTGKGSMYGGEPIDLGLFQHIVWQIQLVRAALLDEQLAAKQLLAALHHQVDSNTLPSSIGTWYSDTGWLHQEDVALAMVLYNSHLWTQDADQCIRNIHAAVLAHFQAKQPANHSQSLANALCAELPMLDVDGNNVSV